MDPGEDPDRAILWKIGRMLDDEKVDEGLAEIYGRIVRFFTHFTSSSHAKFKSSP